MEKIECIVCMRNIRSVVHMPCKHLAMCSTCYEAMPTNNKNSCPVCKVPTNGIAKLYIA
jgi:hypothetical protein